MSEYPEAGTSPATPAGAPPVSGWAVGGNRLRRVDPDPDRHVPDHRRPDGDLQRRLLRRRPQLHVRPRHDRLGLGPPDHRDPRSSRPASACSAGSAVGGRDGDLPGDAQRRRQLLLHPVLPVLGDPRDRAGRMGDLGFAHAPGRDRDLESSSGGAPSGSSAPGSSPPARRPQTARRAAKTRRRPSTARPMDEAPGPRSRPGASPSDIGCRCGPYAAVPALASASRSACSVSLSSEVWMTSPRTFDLGEDLVQRRPGGRAR